MEHFTILRNSRKINASFSFPRSALEYPLMKQSPIFYSLICMLLLILGTGLAKASLPSELTVEDNKNNFQPGFGLIIGSVIMTDGKAVVVHNNQKVGYEIFIGMPLYPKDTIYTQHSGRLLLHMRDDTQMRIGSDSMIVLIQVTVLPKQKTRKSLIQMKMGRAQFYVPKLSKFQKTDFKVKTPTALINGFKFFIQAEPSKTSVTNFDHTPLTVVSLATPEMPVIIMRNSQRIHISARERPSEIENLSPKEIQNLKFMLKFAAQSFGNPNSKNKYKTDDDPTDTTIWMPSETIVSPSEFGSVIPPEKSDMRDHFPENFKLKNEEMLDEQIQQLSENHD